MRTLIALAITLTLGAAAWFMPSLGAQTTAVPQFAYDPSWPKPLPKGWIIGNVIGVAIDAKDHVWVLHRPSTITEQERGAGFALPDAPCCFPAPPVLEFDGAGTLVQGWGGPGPGYTWVDSEHGIFVDHTDHVWIGTPSDSHLLKFTRDGKYVATVGQPGHKEPTSTDKTILGGPAPWVDPATNELFVADGYRNRRVIVFDAATLAFKRMWGAYGNAPDDTVKWTYNPAGTDVNPSKQFQTVTGVAVSKDGLVYVADRQNNRIQVFKRDGSYVTERFILPKTPRGTVDTLSFSPDKAQTYLYDADPRNMRVWILRRSDLAVIGFFGGGGHQGGRFNSPAYIVTDTKGNLYVGEGQDGKRVQKFSLTGFRPTPPPVSK